MEQELRKPTIDNKSIPAPRVVALARLGTVKQILGKSEGQAALNRLAESERKSRLVRAGTVLVRLS